MSFMEVRIRITTIIVVLVVLLSIGVSSYMSLEKWAFEDALYFSVVTMSVGHGYLVPTQQVTKLFTVIYVLSMGSVLLLFLTSIGDIYFRHGHIKIEENVKSIGDRISGRKRKPWRSRSIVSFKRK